LFYIKSEFVTLKVNKKAAKHAPLVVRTEEVFLDSALDLYDQAIEVAVDVKNTGSVNAKEVLRVYVTYPDSGTDIRPIKNLRGFEKVDVKAGGKTKVTEALTDKDLSVWNTERQGWGVLRGTYTLSVGSSSRKLPLTATVSY
jgi:beta-glucosidase